MGVTLRRRSGRHPFLRKRLIATPGMDQARICKPCFATIASSLSAILILYSRSVHRYRNYLKHLEPVIPILMAAIERLG